MEIFIANLPYRIKAAELTRWFAQFGLVQATKIVADQKGQSKGFGFLEITGDAAGYQAINALNGMEIDGREIVVKQTEQPHAAQPSHKRPRNHPVLVASSLKAKIPFY
ncbi:RNA-binding protein [Mucilaginibacter sp.]|uniref:RNA recognition motif domain-containing protein n=1 Tax=Mucilaginibacter sp. TaxID=1882438 RepID=UPI0026192FCE|nr:RNA-binding protein [Mucilaginibacter sp.]MDB4924420.1 hypothetical protein [Mucilaginibacter sp.]